MREGRVSYLPSRGRSGTEHDYETNAYWRTETESAYLSANETNGMNENSPAMRRRTRSPPSPKSSYDDPSPGAALRV